MSKAAEQTKNLQAPNEDGNLRKSRGVYPKGGIQYPDLIGYTHLDLLRFSFITIV